MNLYSFAIDHRKAKTAPGSAAFVSIVIGCGFDSISVANDRDPVAAVQR